VALVVCKGVKGIDGEEKLMRGNDGVVRRRDEYELVRGGWGKIKGRLEKLKLMVLELVETGGEGMICLDGFGGEIAD
jgi:hypothetical protein